MTAGGAASSGSGEGLARATDALGIPGGSEEDLTPRVRQLLRRFEEDEKKNPGKFAGGSPAGGYGSADACPECGDDLWIETPEGGVVRCPHVEREISAGRIGRAQRAAGISKRHARCSFENFQTAGDPVSAEAVEAVEAWVRSFARRLEEGEGLYLHGPPGAGKTHLAYAAVNALMLRPNRAPLGVLVVTGPDLLATIRRGYDPDPETARAAEDFFDAAKSAQLLLLDDLGSAKPSEWTTEQMHALTDHRLREMLPTLVTSNYGPDRMAERVGEAAASRLLEMCEPVRLAAGDHRKISRERRSGRRDGRG